jgi:glycine cleavage system H lipoate-binding protein
MGQKVNPVGFRLGVNRGWDSVWFAKKKDFGNYLIEDFKIREYIKKNVINSGVSKVMIERTASDVYTPVSGEVIDTNQAIVDDPSKINQDPENSAWFFKLKIKDPSEIETLMNKDDYDKFAKETSA